MTATNSRFEAAVTAMTMPENCFDVTIICTTDDYQAEFWMGKLSAGLKKSEESSHFPMVIAVSEDWAPSGAGNGLGTLYAWKKAVALAKTKYNLTEDLDSLLLKGEISAALFHTAGKGTRMAPLPASENNNKPGVVRTKRSMKKKKPPSLQQQQHPRIVSLTHIVLFIYLFIFGYILEIAIFKFFHWSGNDCLGICGSSDWNLCPFSQRSFERILGRPSLLAVRRLSIHTDTSCRYHVYIVGRYSTHTRRMDRTRS